MLVSRLRHRVRPEPAWPRRFDHLMTSDAVDPPDPILRASRLSALARTRLLDSAPEESFDRLTRLAAHTLRAPVSLVSLVDQERQFFKSAFGLPEPWASRRETSLLLSFCQHVVRTDEPLVVHDARRHRQLAGHRAISELGVVSYLGFPLTLSDDNTIGSFCVIDRRARRWSPDQIQMLRDLGGSVMSEIELRLQVRNVAQAVAASEESQARLLLLLESTGEGIYGVDSEGRCTFSNRATCEMLGYSQDELIGRNMHELIHHSYPDGHPYPVEACRVYEAFRTGISTHVEDEALWRRDGSRFDAEYWAHPILRGDAIEGAVVTFRDITNRKRNEAALEKYTRQLVESDRRKDEFLAVLGHELRNPLAAISATAELLALGLEGQADARWAGESISEQVQVLTKLLDDLLDVSRITQGKIVLERRTESVAALVDRAISTARPLIDASKHRLQIDVPGDLYANVDVMRLEQVVVNLLTNAAKYTEPGGTIRVRGWSDGLGVWLSVKDDGRGIPSELQAAIFEPFHQAGSGESSPGGLGIGLTLVKRLVELHGGTVTLQSAGAGLGSEFTIHLVGASRDSLDSDTAQDDVPGALPGGTAAQACRVLVVDDNREAADGIVRLLKREGFEALAVYCGLDALERVRAMKFHALLVDIALPDISGYEIAKRLRADEHQEKLMLVALSGFGHAEARAAARKAGFDHHVAKPARLDKLKQLLIAGRPHV